MLRTYNADAYDFINRYLVHRYTFQFHRKTKYGLKKPPTLNGTGTSVYNHQNSGCSNNTFQFRSLLRIKFFYYFFYLASLLPHYKKANRVMCQINSSTYVCGFFRRYHLNDLISIQCDPLSHRVCNSIYFIFEREANHPSILIRSLRLVKPIVIAALPQFSPIPTLIRKCIICLVLRSLSL